MQQMLAKTAALPVALLLGLMVCGTRVAGLLASTALVTGVAALLAVAIALPIALVVAKTNAPGKTALTATLAALGLLPLHVLASGWMTTLGDSGWVPSFFAGDGPARGWIAGYSGAIVLHAIAGVPWAALLVAVSLRAVDPGHEEQALLEGSSRNVLRNVTLPAAGAGIAAAGVLLAVLASGQIAITDLLRVRTFAEEVYTQAAAGTLVGESAEWGKASRLAAGVGVLGVLALAAVRRFSRAGWGWTAAQRRGLLLRSGALVLAGWFLVGVLVAVPLASLVRQAGVVVETDAGDGYRRTWRASKTLTAVARAPWQHRRELTVSLGLATAVASAATALGAAAVWATRSGRASRLVVVALLALMAATPGPVIGLAVIRGLNQPLDSPLWWLGELYGTWFAPWLAQMVRITPFAALMVAPALLRVPQELLEAARSDGANPLARAALVALPICWPALAAGWIVAFGLSLGELSATALVVPPGTPPLSVRLLSLLHYGVEDRVAAISLVLAFGYGLAAWCVVRLLHAPARRGYDTGNPTA